MPLILLELVFVIVWSSGFVGAELGLRYTEPFTFLFWRYLAVSCLLLATLAARGQRRFFGLDNLQTVWACAVVGVLAQAVWLSAIYWALELGVSAGLTALLTALQPLLVALVAPRFLGEHNSLRRWFGLTLGFVGVALVVGDSLEPSAGVPTLSYALPLVSAASAATAVVYQRRLESISNVPLLPNLTVQSLATLVVITPFTYFAEGFAVSWAPVFVFALGWMIVVATLLSYGLLWTLVKHLSSVRISSLIYYTPPVTMVLAFLVFGDRVTPLGLLGLGVAAVGVWLVRKEVR